VVEPRAFDEQGAGSLLTLAPLPASEQAGVASLRAGRPEGFACLVRGGAVGGRRGACGRCGGGVLRSALSVFCPGVAGLGCQCLRGGAKLRKVDRIFWLVLFA
jgi:hypothetical protein